MTQSQLERGAAAPALPDPALVERIRAHFPALLREHAGRPVAYFDGPGGTQVPRQVVDAMSDYLFNHNANTHWVYPSSVETDAMIERSREALADFVNGRPTEIAFGQNMSSLTFHLARALGRRWAPGDAVVVTELDHQANVAPWRALEKERGIVVKVARMHRESGTLDLDHLGSLLTPKVRLVAVGAASNAIGTITDVARVARMARSVGALVFVDAVHYAPHALVDVRALDCDFLACSAYKFYGPHVGALWGREQLLAELDVPKLEPAPDNAPDRLETGTQSHESMVGAAAAVDFLASFGEGRTRRERLVSSFGLLHAVGDRLARRLWDGLHAIPKVTVYGVAPGNPRTPTVSFAMDGVPSEEVARRLVDDALFVSNGDFYATTCVMALGQAEHGLVRVGAACYTTEEEVGRLLEGVGKVAKG